MSGVNPENIFFRALCSSEKELNTGDQPIPFETFALTFCDHLNKILDEKRNSTVKTPESDEDIFQFVYNLLTYAVRNERIIQMIECIDFSEYERKLNGTKPATSPRNPRQPS